jgi:uncharacterized protein (DUF362 family)/NAD-dependent dihydropyrimidine dehydrogenase PreA subunit
MEVQNTETRSAVAIVRCASYAPGEVSRAVAKGITLLGGVKAIFKDKKRVLLKPNMLLGLSAESGATTNPAVFVAVAGLLKDHGFDLYYGDSPGFGSVESVIRKCGIKEQADVLGIPLADFEKGSEVRFKEGLQNKLFYIARGVLEIQTVVNLPKMKTHSLTVMTGAIKNMFGVIPGLRKAAFHARLADPQAFARMLIDLTRFITPELNIMDAVVGMEGNGPSHGDPVHSGLLLFSKDAAALDATACRIMGIAPERLYFLNHAHKSGLGNIFTKNIEIRGVELDDCRGRPYRLSASHHWQQGTAVLQKYGKRFLIPRPVINKYICTRCGVCVNICPVRPKALAGHNSSVPVYDYERCIRCYCCQEMCPAGAIKAAVPLLGALYYGFRGRS